MPKTAQKTPKEVATELAEGRRTPFHAFGRDWEGDIFYSTVYLATKERDYAFTAEVTEEMRRMGFYVHS